jgi:hypothetical protein
LLTGFSVTSLLLAAIGIFGVLNYRAPERSRELGFAWRWAMRDRPL